MAKLKGPQPYFMHESITYKIQIIFLNYGAGGLQGCRQTQSVASDFILIYSTTAASHCEPLLMYLPSATPSWKAEVNYELSWVKGGAQTILKGVT